jgi:rubrerythrin
MAEADQKSGPEGSGEIKVWRCRVCGYLCARPEPPETCPICKVSRERFEEFKFP